MTDNLHKDHNLLSADKPRGFWKALTFLGISLGMMLVLFVAGAYVWAQEYEGRIPPNVYIGELALGGLDPEQAQVLLQEKIDEIVTGGLVVRVDGEEKPLSLVTLVSTDLIEDVAFYLDDTIENLMAFHGTTPHGDTLRMLERLFEPVHTGVLVSAQEDLVKARVLELFPETESLSVSASFQPALTSEGWLVNVKTGEAGREFQWEPFFETLSGQLTLLDTSTIEIGLLDQEPRVSVASAKSQSEAATAALAAAPYKIALTDEGLTWELTAEQLSEMLLPGEDGQLALDEELLTTWTETITTSVDSPAQDARLELTDGRVTDFVESENGQSVAINLLTEELLTLVRSPEEKTIELTIVTEEPSVTVADINDLGITEILGTGTSSYRGSPWNRQQNIQNGVDLLNGILIAPEETFSLVESLSPFTFENGYLPELVIKGDKIEPEIGGGLCQIGTTTFRATMNAGLSVAERRNHSLVVSYYNDPSNGLPGTDATIYEPAPDYKFTNNTDSYVLFQAENLTETQELRFTFWGTSDGRQGSYTAPVVHRWIPVGETQYIETEDLEPGEEECQEAHIGADTSFTYSVAHPDGELEETTFDSHYRPLAKICLVGIDPDAEEENEESVEGSSEEEASGAEEEEAEESSDE